ncbi:hypothetical protein P691DRAFT_788673 [Macrolepiota fuliginosa MF-IS2]|uniref:Uncharacterized protein n=1 Tax=Macrolepiota fuliginosa MF-IS2 TaxID=1400762 RepID=A0A9P5X3G6_9AGAR|nr:hypothetical protein P691DRAFT_788673 [Macrolepiota fuliginosa MF-IS2]
MEGKQEDQNHERFRIMALIITQLIHPQMPFHRKVKPSSDGWKCCTRDTSIVKLAHGVKFIECHLGRYQDAGLYFTVKHVTKLIFIIGVPPPEHWMIKLSGSRKKYRNALEKWRKHNKLRTQANEDGVITSVDFRTRFLNLSSLRSLGPIHDYEMVEYTKANSAERDGEDPKALQALHEHIPRKTINCMRDAGDSGDDDEVPLGVIPKEGAPYNQLDLCRRIYTHPASTTM